jgi:hypothetical protein
MEVLLEQSVYSRRNRFGPVVQGCINALHLQLIPSIGAFERVNFPRECAAGDD